MEPASANHEDRLRIARSFIEQAPPGEIGDVLNDVKVLVGDETVLDETTLEPILAQYDMDQLVALPVPWGKHKVILCEAGHLGENRYADPRGGKSFTVDHLTHTIGTEPEELPPTPQEGTRKELQVALDTYIESHYPQGTGAVFVKGSAYHMVIEDSKYSADNFWNGRWRSHWIWHGGKVEGIIHVAVHYFEDGNVQLASKQKFSLDMEDTSKVDTVLKAIAKTEAEHHVSLNESYFELSENGLRNLRRALPLTKTKIEWNKIANYRIGSELAGK